MVGFQWFSLPFLYQTLDGFMGTLDTDDVQLWMLPWIWLELRPPKLYINLAVVESTFLDWAKTCRTSSW